MRPLLLIILLLVLAAACSSDRVSQAQYDQRVAELALAQQDLLAERNRAAALEGELESLDPEALVEQIAVLQSEVEQRDALAASLVEQLGGTASGGEFVIEQVIELLGDSDPLSDPNTTARLDAYLSTISLLVGLGFEPVPDVGLIEDLRPVIDATLDMELTTRFDELMAAAGTDRAAYRSEALRFIQDAADFASQVNAGGRPPG